MEIIILMIVVIVSFVVINTLLLIVIRKILDLYHERKLLKDHIKNYSRFWKGRIDE